MAAGGRTYERAALLQFWSLRERPLDPLTNRALEDARLITNFEKRSEVKSFLDSHPDYIPDGWENREIPPPVETVRFLLETATYDDDVHELAQAIWHVRRFLDEMREFLIAPVPPWRARDFFLFGVLLLLLISLATLLAHPIWKQLACPLQRAGDNPEKLVALLITGAREIQHAVIQKMDALGSTEKNLEAFINAGASVPLLNYLKDCKSGERLGGFSVLQNLAAKRPDVVIQSGAIEVAAEILQTGNINEQERAAIIIWNLAVQIEHRDRIGSSGAIAALSQHLDSSSPSLRQNAANLIGILATDNLKNQAKSIRAGALESLTLMTVANDAGDRKAAEYALDVLGRSYVRDLFLALGPSMVHIAATCLILPYLINSAH